MWKSHVLYTFVSVITFIKQSYDWIRGREKMSGWQEFIFLKIISIIINYIIIF